MTVPVFTDLMQLEAHSLAAMVCPLQQLRPNLSKGDAVVVFCQLVIFMWERHAQIKFQWPTISVVVVLQLNNKDSRLRTCKGSNLEPPDRHCFQKLCEDHATRRVGNKRSWFAAYGHLLKVKINKLKNYSIKQSYSKEVAFYKLV